LKDIRPYVQQFEKVLDRILGGNKFTVTSTNILLMAIVILLITLIMTKQETVVKIQSKEKSEKQA
jgi:hypothetical protein